MPLKTPLYPFHEKHQGKIVDFNGYLLPVQYPTGIIAEHMAVRKHVGLFDCSHMAEIEIAGSGALAYINKLLSNDFTTMKDGGVRYTAMLNEKGTVIDDMLVYRFNEDKYWLICNAGNHQKDWAWIQKHAPADVVLNDRSERNALLALQGPETEAVLAKCMDSSQLPSKYYSFVENVDVGGVKALVSRTGYTGEDGFEFYLAPEDAVSLADFFVENIPNLCLCGLGARDTLRLEAGMPLYGHEMDEETSPLNAGLGRFVKMDKADFIGKEALSQQAQTHRRIGLKLLDKGIARQGCPVLFKDEEIGLVTSGTMLPAVNYSGASATVLLQKVSLGDVVDIQVRKRLLKAEVIALPFYKKA